MLQDNKSFSNNNLASIGARIQRNREQRGFSREKLAEASGLSVQSIVKIESGTRNFRILSLISIACALGVSTDSLLGLTNPDDLQNIQLLSSMLDSEGKAFIKGTIQLYLQFNKQ